MPSKSRGRPMNRKQSYVNGKFGWAKPKRKLIDEKRTIQALRARELNFLQGARKWGFGKNLHTKLIKL